MGDIIHIEPHGIFGLKIYVTMCDDAPCSVYNFSQKAEQAFNWAKDNLIFVDAGIDYDQNLYLMHIPNDIDAMHFKIRWVGN